jgi:mannose-6-phosphate isomerase-like protein (cupin superfamily)
VRWQEEVRCKVFIKALSKETQMPRRERDRRSVVFHQKIRKTAKKNFSFRRGIYEGKFSDLAVMSIRPGAELGEEAHKNTDEILFVVKGKGEVTLNGRKERIRRHDAVFVASGEDHNLKNVGRKDLKLLCVCAPPSSHVNAGIHKSGETEEQEQLRYGWEQ